MITKKVYILVLIFGAISFFVGITTNKPFFTIISFITFLICFVIVVIYLTTKANKFNHVINEIEKTEAEAEFELKGLNFTKAGYLIEENILKENSLIQVKPELNNQYDQNAMVVTFNNNKIGYVDRENAIYIKDLYQKGFRNGYVSKIIEYENESTSEPYYFVIIVMPFIY